MPIRTVLILAIMFLVIPPMAWSYTATCYPEAAAYNTGTTDGATKPETSLVRAVSPEDGWMRFNISAIPDGQNILTVHLHFYLTYSDSHGSPPFTYFTSIDTDPLIADAATLWADITGEQSTSTAYNWLDSEGLSPGWYIKPLHNGALQDLESSLAQDWFAVGVATWLGAKVRLDGWA